ncbi:MAG TPA: hypothetical protein VFG38_09015 [Pseudomonadales bacterium]|nr:hypothetical protein [Pseudomonadales bacterium]
MPRNESPEPSSARRPIRLFVTLVLAMGVTYYGGREFGLGNDELIGFLLASVGLVAAAGVVGLLLFGVLRLIRRG